MTDTSELMHRILDAEASFTERPEVVPGDLRAPWRVALLVMLLDHCHGKSATMEQIHVMGWAMLDESTRAQMRAAISGDIAPDTVLVRYDPAWSRAMDLAVGLGLATWITSSGRLRLTDTGKLAARDLQAGNDSFGPERTFLNGLTITQAMIGRLMGNAR